MKKPKEEDPEPSAPFWMTTYGDMVTLIMTFFILLISFSTMELEKFKGALESFRGALGVLPGHESPQPFDQIQLAMENREVGKLLDKQQQIEDVIIEEEWEEAVEVEMTAEGLLIRLGDDMLFDLGKAEIKPGAKPILDSIAKLVKNDQKEMYVEGHTDNIPIRTRLYPSNWELSSARALNVVKYFYEVNNIPQQYLAAVGHGEHRPRVPNDSPENQAKNRRVEILIKDDK